MTRLLSVSGFGPVLAALLVSVSASAETADPHAHHHGHEMKRATRSQAHYAIPDVDVVRDDGKTVHLRDELADGSPVALNFIFTTCTTICPVMSSVFSQLQEKLERAGEKVRLVSISIDPEQDTPARLAEYAKKFKAGPEWRHYTGTTQTSIAIQRAFAAYRGDKMNHTPVTFLRAAHGDGWARIDGFASSDDLIAQLHELLASR
jgi:protein SCO1/2